MTARMARKYLTWRRLPWCWAFFRWRFTALRSEGDMVKRIQHIGPFLRNEMGVSLRGMSPMCDHSSIHLSENLFLKVYINTSDIFLAKGVNKNGHELVECELTTHSQEHGHDNCPQYPQADACGGSTTAQVPCHVVQHNPRATGPRQLS